MPIVNSTFVSRCLDSLIEKLEFHLASVQELGKEATKNKQGKLDARDFLALRNHLRAAIEQCGRLKSIEQCGRLQSTAVKKGDSNGD